MSTDSFVLSETDKRGVTTLTLNRPDKHNAFDDGMIEQLTYFLKEAISSENTRIIVLKAEGKNFSAGADLNWMKNMAQYSEEENIDDATDLGKLMHVLYHSPKPTIAIVQGKTFGGGIGLVACCQIAIAQKNASFCFSEARLGIIPAVISPFILNAIGPRWTRHYFLTAKTFNAQEAHMIGLCQEIVEENELSHKVNETINHLLANGPAALETINKLINEMTPLTINDNLLQSTATLIAKIRVSEEGQMGLSAFLNKMKPKWAIHD